MTCQSCIDAVKSSLRGQEGIVNSCTLMQICLFNFNCKYLHMNHICINVYNDYYFNALLNVDQF